MESHQLSYALTGADAIADLARHRFSGVVTLEQGAQEISRASFYLGRPASVLSDAEQQSATPDDLKTWLIHAGQQATGMFRTEAISGNSQAQNISHSIDPLGELLLACIRTWPAEFIEQAAAARSDVKFQPTPGFDVVAKAIQSVGGPELATFSEVMSGSELYFNLSPDPLLGKRAFLALTVLQGVRRYERPKRKPRPEKPSEVDGAQGGQKGATSSGESLGQGQAAEPAPPAQAIHPRAAEINTMYEKVQHGSYYDVLGVNKDAPADEIKSAYFELAKVWHSDAFSEQNLGSLESKVEAIFQQISEAFSVLKNADQRKQYDLVQDREAAGLPTDAVDAIEAETLFQKGESMVRRGQAVKAEPLLRAALDKNKGDAEFWAYWGYAAFCKDPEGQREKAIEALNKAIEVRDKCEAAYEFLGKIARTENRFDDAKKNFSKLLELNPGHHEAARELRLVDMRRKSAQKGDDAAGGWRDKVFGLLGKKS